MNERDESGSEEIAERRTEKQTNYGQGIKAQKRYRRERSEEENQDRKMMKKKSQTKHNFGIWKENNGCKLSYC